MHEDNSLPIIAFLWRPRNISSAVVEAARRTGTRCLFDLTAGDLDAAAVALLQAGADGGEADIKVSPEALLDDGIDEFLAETAPRTLWVELHPFLVAEPVDTYLDKLESLSDRIDTVPIVSDVDILRELVSSGRFARVALKGSEAAGFVSPENGFTLFGTLRDLAGKSDSKTGLVMWGGIATPEAAAAFLASGAAGIVFESIHWLTDLVGAEPALASKIAALRPEHTDLVGLNLDVPCRLFNKGNSKAVKELREFTGSLCGEEIRDEQRRFFSRRVQAESVHPSESSLGRDELIPLGVEAAFADSFVERFGDRTDAAIEGFLRAVEALCHSSVDKQNAFVNSPTARKLGVRYPFVQGAMSWITDVPAFAGDVAAAGALPTVALGLMDRATLDRKLGSLKETMGDAPFAVNVITLHENPYRNEQLAWIVEQQPRFAVIAAGEPSHARELLDHGIEVMYIAPNEELLRMAFEEGVRYAICEGNEAGGHVGEYSTLTLAQTVLELRRKEPNLFEDRHVILAGGVFNRETAFIAAMLGADAIQMGTAYLATKEIVDRGALSELYQRMILEAVPGATVVTGEGTGLRVRSLRTARMEAICTLEREFASGSEDEAAFRQRIEELSAGSLFVAARCLDRPDGSPIPESECIERGQFMSGACAGSVNTVHSLEELHREVAAGPLPAGVPFFGPLRTGAARAEADVVAGAVPSTVSAGATVRAPSVPERERIAVTGMAIVNSLGNSPDEVWAASVAMKSGIREVPPSKWNHALFFDPRPRVSEKTYCKVGAFQSIEIDRKELGIPPQDFRTMTDSTRITMWLAKQAIEQSGILDSDIPRERIGVFISQNSGEAAATLQDVIIRGAADKIVNSLKGVVPFPEGSEAAVEEAVKAGRMMIDDTTLLGRLNCSAGGFICNKYGFMGPSFAVSAACATALVALYSAYQMIRNGIIDAAVIGGAEEPLTPMHFLEFSALGALAGLSGVERTPYEASRPFDEDRDGMVLGEGGGMIVIERESLARKRHAPIHGLITAMGASNNNTGMVESSRKTQELAIGASYDDAPYTPASVDMVECHATSTKQGDAEEVRALKTFFGPDTDTVLTSFKSQIGHTLGASGVNSLIRGIMAMKNGVFPPTLNYDHADPDVELERSGFRVLRTPEEWNGNPDKPRRFQVNAFGFGGSNYVVHVEQDVSDRDAVLVSPPKTESPAEPSEPAVPIPTGLSFFTTRIGRSDYRVGVISETDESAESLLRSVEPVVNGGPIGGKRLRALARQGVYLSPSDIATQPLAFVFPGQGSHYAGMGHELYDSFPIVRDWMDRIAEVAEFDLLDLLFHNTEEDLQKTRWQQPALFTLEYSMVRYLVSLGVRPVAMAGHSLGELTALCLAGVYSYADGFRIVNKRALCMDKACDMNTDPGIMMAVDAPMDVVEEHLSRANKVYITNINSPHQIVIGGDTEEVRQIGEDLKALGHRRTQLRVSMAFHSPIMECIHDELEEFIAGIDFHPPQIPVISNTTMQPFPADPVEIRKIVMAHLESPVHWMQNVHTLRNDFGVGTFVEVGPRDILSNMIGDTLSDAECIQTCLPSVEGLMYRTAIAQLYTRGHFTPPTEPKFVSFPGQSDRREEPKPVAAPPKPAPKPSAPAPSTIPVSAAAPTGLEGIIQREINAFVLESFGRFIKPGLLEAIRREHDPSFTEDRLDRVLGGMMHSTPPPMAPTAPTVEAPVSVPPPAAAPEAIPAAEEAVTAEEGGEDTTEAVIRIIMDATGYDRDEIEPDMDLREDLSIRSSRLPVIMDSVENHFGLKIELEEFMDVRTIRDIADRIDSLIARKKGPSARSSKSKPGTRKSEESADSDDSESPAVLEPVKRVVFEEVPLGPGRFQQVEIDTMETVAILSAGGGTGFRRSVGTVFRRDYGTNPENLLFMKDSRDGDAPGFDLRTVEGADAAEELLDEIESWAGIVIVLDDLFEERLTGLQDLSPMLGGFFRIMKEFLESPTKKFALLIHRSEGSYGPARILAEGILGMFLSMAHEFSSVQFRSLRVDDATDLSVAVRSSLDRSHKPLEMVFRGGEAFTAYGRQELPDFTDEPTLSFNKGDVVVFSGGGYGITSRLARTLAPFGCSLVFLGRTSLDTGLDLDRLIERGTTAAEDIERFVRENKAGLTDSDVEREVGHITKAAAILKNLSELQSMGADATYLVCDVTDREQCRETVEWIAEHYGKIDGVVHGAGILKDAFVKYLSPDEFSQVIDVKYGGALNLTEAAASHGLRFAVCLSSAAAVQGNPGQSNYSAGNRMMSALMAHAAAQASPAFCKALMLPPIEGSGMAEDPEIRALMKRMNAAYVHEDELTGLFVKELTLAPDRNPWVMFLRSLPDLETVRIDQSNSPDKPGTLQAGGVRFPGNEFPMIDSLAEVDLKRGTLIGTRAFSQDKDLWLPDHKPFKFLKHPLVSAIMALETMMEAARILYPHLTVRAVRDARFLDIIECPPGIERISRIECTTREIVGPEVTCAVRLSSREISPSGRALDRSSSNYEALIVSRGGANEADVDLTGFPVDDGELTSRPMDQAEVIEWYRSRTDMRGRYRLMERLFGTAPDAVKGMTVYREIEDFRAPLRTAYQYAPYLLEALMQAVNFFVIMRDTQEKRSMIPFGIGEVILLDRCDDGEEVLVEARMRDQDNEGITWDARAVDSRGRTLIFARNMVMRWFSQ